MEYKVGDRVRVQSLEQYNKYKNRHGDINYGCETEILFTSEMSSFCGQVVTITRVRYIGCVRFYHIAEDEGAHLWVAGMFEGLVEEEVGLVDRLSSRWVNEFNLPDGYFFKDENGNIINATKIVLEKKKKEYPKTYEECCEIMNVIMETEIVADAYLERLDDYELNLDTKIENLRKLLICRDAYWKIAGEEMGLGKPWEPDWEDEHQEKYIIGSWLGTIQGLEENFVSHPFAFPTEEMRDAFKANFDKDIEICKELL